MNSSTALAIAKECAVLTHQCATYQARYGRHYVVKPGSTEDAWTLYHAITQKQTDIATLLDNDVLEHEHTISNRWWERHDTPDLTIAQALMREAAGLIGCCAYIEAENTPPRTSHLIFSAQLTIADLLHPAARQMALAHHEEQSKSQSVRRVV